MEELQLIGLLILDNERYYKAETLTADKFEDKELAVIFSTIMERVPAGQPCGAANLIQYLGEPFKEVIYSASKAAGASYAWDIRGLAHAIHINWQERMLQEAMRDAQAMTGEVADKVMHLQSVLEQMMQESGTIGIQDVVDVENDIFHELQNPLESLSTGVKALDDALGGGLYPQRSYCFAGRPKAGKTMILGTICQNLTTIGVPHIYIAAEMGAKQIQMRALARAIGRSTQSFYSDRDKPEFIEKIMAARQRRKGICFYKNAQASGLAQLKSTINHAVTRYGVKVVILDYLQLITADRPKGTNDSEWQYQIAQWLADASKKLNITCIYAVQLNRDGYVRGSDGAVMAADYAFSINRSEQKIGDRYHHWFDCIANRHGEPASVGSEEQPKIELVRGTHFQDCDMIATPKSFYSFG